MNTFKKIWFYFYTIFLALWTAAILAFGYAVIIVNLVSNNIYLELLTLLICFANGCIIGNQLAKSHIKFNEKWGKNEYI